MVVALGQYGPFTLVWAGQESFYNFSVQVISSTINDWHGIHLQAAIKLPKCDFKVVIIAQTTSFKFILPFSRTCYDMFLFFPNVRLNLCLG